MRILPLFIILILFSGAIILCYLGWVAFRSREDHFTIQHVKAPQGSFKDFNTKPLIGDGDVSFDNLNKDNFRESDPNAEENEGLPPGLISMNRDILKDPDLQRKIDLLKMKVISNLRRYILASGKTKGMILMIFKDNRINKSIRSCPISLKDHINDYSVDFTKLKPRGQKMDRKQVLCKLKNVKLKLLNQRSSKAFKDKQFPNEGIFTSGTGEGDKFNGEIKPESLYKSCAVIPNSAAFDGAKHGIDIGNF